MAKFYEIDFLEVGNSASGDAMSIRYADDSDIEFIHVVDGGYSDDGDNLVEHIKKFYGNPSFVDHVVLTHPDGDHASGLRKVVDEFDVGTLWMNRPWVHVNELLPLFNYDYTRDGLIQRLKKDFPFTAELEKVALENGIEISDVFQGTQIGEFITLAPSKDRYIRLIVDSEKTPEPERRSAFEGTIFERVVRAVRNKIAEWGEENLKGDTEGTSAENESSVVQFSELCDEKILLTGDAGVEGLEEAFNYAIFLGIDLPGVKLFDVPHHGSRRNVSPDVLDKWLGPKLAAKPAAGEFDAIISANRNDKNHPRKAVVRALIHRGANVYQPKGTLHCHKNAPARDWSTAAQLEYPQDMED